MFFIYLSDDALDRFNQFITVVLIWGGENATEPVLIDVKWCCVVAYSCRVGWISKPILIYVIIHLS